jgi:hypothetical protein
VQDSADVIDFFITVWKQPDLHDISRQVLANESFWGLDINDLPGATNCVAHYLKMINEGSWELMPS